MGALLLIFGIMLAFFYKTQAVPLDANLRLINSYTASNASSLSAAKKAAKYIASTIIVENCGPKELDINDMLFEVVGALHFAQEDALLGFASQHGLQAFFKRGAVKDTVRVFLKHMMVMEGVPGLQPMPQAISRPRFACVNYGSWNTYRHLQLGYDPYVRCQSAAVQEDTTLRSFHAEGTSYIFLCENFFDLAVEPRLDYCPVVKGNRFQGYQEGFHRHYQIYRIIYQLSRFYLGRHALDAKSDPREMWDWNDCIFKLNEVESVINPSNWELYVAMVMEDCDRAPIPALGSRIVVDL